jgi:hypothetical protein
MTTSLVTTLCCLEICFWQFPALMTCQHGPNIRKAVRPARAVCWKCGAMAFLLRPCSAGFGSRSRRGYSPFGNRHEDVHHLPYSRLGFDAESHETQSIVFISHYATSRRRNRSPQLERGRAPLSCHPEGQGREHWLRALAHSNHPGAVCIRDRNQARKWSPICHRRAVTRGH